MTIKVRKHKGNICKGWSQVIFLTYNSNVGNKIFQGVPCEWSHKFKLGTNFGTCEQIFLVHMKRTVFCNHSLQLFPVNIPLMSNDLYHNYVMNCPPSLETHLCIHMLFFYQSNQESQDTCIVEKSLVPNHYYNKVDSRLQGPPYLKAVKLIDNSLG